MIIFIPLVQLNILLQLNLLILMQEEFKCEHAADLTAPQKQHSKHVCVCREPNWPNDIYAAIKLALTVAMIHLRIWEFLPPTGATRGGKCEKDNSGNIVTVT